MEQAGLAAAEMIQYAGAVEGAISRLRLVNHCLDTQINFSSARFADATSYDNATAPADGSCNVFGTNGGNITWKVPPSFAQNVGGVEYAFTGHVGILEAGQGSGDASCVPADTDGQEILMLTNVSREMCMQINNKLGIVNTGDNPPVATVANYDIPLTAPEPFVGNYVADAMLGIAVCGAPELRNQRSGCYKNNTNGKYLFYSVVLGR